MSVLRRFFFLNVFFLSSAYRPTEQKFNKSLEGEVVDKVVLYNDKDSNMCIKILTRHTRRPEVSFV